MARHGLLFALAKSTVLLAPLLAASRLSVSQYGAVEWWLSIALAVAPLAALGSHALIAYGSVGSKSEQHVRAASVYVLVVSALLVLTGVTVLAGANGTSSSVIGPVVLLSALSTMQLALSARLKGLGYGGWASLAESSVYLCLFLSLLVSPVRAGFEITFFSLLVLAYLATACVFCRLSDLGHVRDWRAADYRGFAKAGLGFVAGGAAVGLFMAAPRAVLGAFYSHNMVAQFSLVFRWLSISIVAHQFINTVFFRRLFNDGAPANRDRPLSQTVVLVAVVSMAIVFLLSLGVGRRFGLPMPSPDISSLNWIMAIAMVLWSVTACLEGTLYCAGQARRQASAATAGLAVALLGMLLVRMLGIDAVYGIAGSWLVGFAVTIASQFRALGQSRVELPRLLNVAVGAVIVFVVTAFCVRSFR